MVIGAGVAGLTAAMAAARLGVRQIALIEQSPRVMPLQSKSRSRWIDPVQYDWPALHWAQKRWPTFEPAARKYTAVSVPYRTLTAALSQDWALEFQNRVSPLLGREITPSFHTKVQDIQQGPSGIQVTLQDTRTKTQTVVQPNIVIVATGFGAEKSTTKVLGRTDTFVGLDFWADDKFEAPRMGIPSLKHWVLISGSGDGALQDFIRLVTGVQAAGELMHAATSHPAAGNWRAMLADLWHWEDHAAKARLFAPTPISECEITRRLHNRYEEVLDSFVLSPSWIPFAAWLDAKVKGRPLGTVRLILKCDHFGHCYGLNRMAALMLIRYLDTRGAASVEKNTALIGTAAVGHTCGSGCWGEVHRVSLAQGTSCDTAENDLATWPASKVKPPEFVDGLVIRHGIDSSSLGKLGQRLRRQVLPSHLP